MTSLDLHYYPPKAERKAEHPIWVFGDDAFLDALVAFLRQFHNGRFPEFRFRFEGNTLFVQIWLGDEQKTFIPGEYQPEFDRILGHCRGFEAGWMARRPS